VKAITFQEDDMTKIWIGIIAAVAALAGCAPMATAPGSAAAPSIQGTPGKAVIYIVRTRPDTSYLTGALTLNGDPIGATHAGTYMRLEVAPGRHRLSGYAGDNGAITLDTQADRVYFVQHSVSGSWRAQSPHSFFTIIDEARARAAMAGAVNAQG
jgi:hypothetical protein